MYLDTDSTEHHDFIWMVKNAVVPRPIAWVGSESCSGNGNLAPYSYFGLVTMDPPTLMVSFIGDKHSYDNIRETGEFVVNLISDGLAEVSTASAAAVPRELDEAALLGLATLPSRRIAPRRLAEAKVALECTRLSEVALHDARVVFAEVVAVHADDAILDETGRIDTLSYRPVGRLGGSTYTTVASHYRHVVPVPTAEWLAGQVGSGELLRGTRPAQDEARSGQAN
jgi:flavin reductase (DIM6/NTAB) family NADH-FMN oxidoreductase RutF